MRYFGIQVVDAKTGRGVPLVTLRTTSEMVYVTDSAGWVAIDEPGWAGQKVYFAVASHGYLYPADGFGFRGVAVTVTPGATAQIKLPRVNIAERLYRLTGEGIYRDTELLGKKPPLPTPFLRARVTGQDSALAVRYKGKFYWFWGDTGRLEYPLGNFQTTGATAPLTTDPEKGIAYTYLTDSSGFSKKLLPIDAPGPVWVTGVAVIENGQKLIAYYMRQKDLGTSLERGLALWNDAKQEFERVARFPADQPLPLTGHSYLATADGRPYLFGTREGSEPLPCVRVAPTLAALKNPAAYEVWDGRQWRTGATPPAVAPLRDALTGKPVQPHNGTIFWNAYRQRWIFLIQQRGGIASNIGEIWYSEATTPLGPWTRARQILTHDKQDFYNPVHHPFFDRGPYLYFEGTYVNTFSGNPLTTPRYNYNQILYRLDLRDPRLR